MANSKFGRSSRPPLSPETLANLAASAPAGLTAPMSPPQSQPEGGGTVAVAREPATYDLPPKRPPGRRRKPIAEVEERHPFLVRLPVAFYARLDAMANRDGMSINEIILRMVADGFRADDGRKGSPGA